MDKLIQRLKTSLTTSEEIVITKEECAALVKVLGDIMEEVEGSSEEGAGRGYGKFKKKKHGKIHR